MVGGDPVAVEVLEQLGAVLHANRVVVERRTVPHQQLYIRVRSDVIKRKQPLQNACYVELQRLLEWLGWFPEKRREEGGGAWATM